MARIGFFCFLGRGHLNPSATLARLLMLRGHDVTMFHLSIAEAAVRAFGLPFRALDRDEKPAAGSAEKQQPRRIRCLDTLAAIREHAGRVLRAAPAEIKAARIEALVIDQSDVAAGSVAEMLGVPFLTLCCAPPAYLDPVLPAPFFGWQHATGVFANLRNRAGNFVVGRLAAPVLDDINILRKTWKLPRLTHINDTFSTLGILTQLPEFLDFPRSGSGPPLFHTGPLRSGPGQIVPKFPWHKLNGKPLIYGSMGTIRNNLPWVFRTIAEACADFEYQLVLSVGGGRLQPKDLGPLPGDPLVVHYAPQFKLLQSAKLAINCAGLNTTLDCVATGVPLVAIPAGEDQPGVAARIERAGIGRVVPLSRLSKESLRKAIQRVLSNPAYRESTCRFQRQLLQLDGVNQAANIVERLLRIRTCVG